MEIDYQRIIDCIDPALTNRQEWVQVGMALKQEGCPFEMFDDWSARDPRPGQYQGTDVTRKVWDSFRGLGNGTVTGATLTKMARDQGHDPFPKQAEPQFFDWSDDVTDDGENRESVSYPRRSARIQLLKPRKKPPFQIIDYLEACFKPEDHVNILCSSFTDPAGKKKPKGFGLLSPTVQEYIDRLREEADKPEVFENIFGDYDHDAGVWIRINPISGDIKEDQKGISDRNVTSWDNALIECDELDLNEQITRIRELELPYKALVYSGGKSIHAIVGVNAKSYADYQDRVQWLRDYCRSHDLPVDTQNVNPSRLSRLPGCQRGEKKQELLEVQKPVSFDEWKKKAIARDEAMNLHVQSFADVWQDLPPLAPELVHGILRQGHKMLISGAPKAGKSFLLIELAVAIAEGGEWIGYQCEQGRVLYLNFEVDEASFWHRIRNVYQGKGLPVAHPENLDVLNLRGQAERMDQLTPKLEYLMKRTKYSLVIIDPIYKVITGDENNASDMGKFCNLFDRIGRSGGCSVAYCHHHSKGSQAQKSIIDRASGSGVFARDPDAIVDMTELEISETDRAEIRARFMEEVNDRLLHESGQWDNLAAIKPESLTDRIAKQDYVEEFLTRNPGRRETYESDLKAADEIACGHGFRVSMTLREFKTPDPIEVLFGYPVHVLDHTGYMKSLFLNGDNNIGSLNKKKAEVTEKRRDEKTEYYKKKRESGETVTISEMTKRFSCSVNTIKRWAAKADGITTGNGYVLWENEEMPSATRKKSANL